MCVIGMANLIRSSSASSMCEEHVGTSTSRGFITTIRISVSFTLRQPEGKRGSAGECVVWAGVAHTASNECGPSSKPQLRVLITMQCGHGGCGACLSTIAGYVTCDDRTVLWPSCCSKWRACTSFPSLSPYTLPLRVDTRQNIGPIHVDTES